MPDDRPTKTNARRAPGGSHTTRQRARARYSTQPAPVYTPADPYTRCAACHDPAREGWTYCDRCHAWDDLYHGLHPPGPGIDQRRLDRARDHFAGRRQRETTQQLLRRLMGRVVILENALSHRLLATAELDPDWQTR